MASGVVRLAQARSDVDGAALQAGARPARGRTRARRVARRRTPRASRWNRIGPMPAAMLSTTQ